MVRISGESGPLLGYKATHFALVWEVGRPGSEALHGGVLYVSLY